VNDHTVTRYMETGMFPTTAAGLRAYVTSVSRHPDNVFLAILEKEGGAHVGNVKLGPIHWLHRRGDLGIMLGAPHARGRGFGREVVALVLEYGFRRLGLEKITLGLDAEHAAALRLYESAGFKIEGTLRRHLFRDGAWHDKHVMAVLREDFERRAAR